MYSSEKHSSGENGGREGGGKTNKYQYRTMYLWCVYILFVNAVCLMFAVVYTGRETSPKELYALTALIAVPLFYFGGAGSAVFWIIGIHMHNFVYFYIEHYVTGGGH